MRQTLWRIELYFNLAPVAVLNLVVWTVSEHILVAQLYSNLCSHIGQFVGIVDGEQASAGHLGDFGQQGRAGDFFRLGGRQAEDPDGVNLHIGLFDHGFDLVFGITAVVIAAIGNDQQGLFAVAGVLHLAHAHVNGIEHGRAALGHGVNQLALDIFNRFGEIGAQLRAIIEGDHEKFVLRVRRLKELDHGFAGLQDLVIHTPAHVKNHAQRDRRVFTGEVLDFLHLAAFQDGEILLVQPGDDAVPVVSYGDVDQHQVYVHLYRLGVVLQAGFGGGDRRIFGISRFDSISRPGLDM